MADGLRRDLGVNIAGGLIAAAIWGFGAYLLTSRSPSTRAIGLAVIINCCVGVGAYFYGRHHRPLDPEFTRLLDSLAKLVADAEQAIRTASVCIPGDAGPAWSAAHAIRDAVNVARSRLDAETVAVLAQFADLAQEAIYRFNQMASPGTWDGERDLAEWRIRHRLTTEVQEQGAKVVQRFRWLRRIERLPRTRRRRRSPLLTLTPLADGRTIYLNVHNRHGRAIVRARVVSTKGVGLSIPYPLVSSAGSAEICARGPFGGGDFVLARTESVELGHAMIDLRERITLPGADGSDAARRHLWDPQPRTDSMIWHQPVVHIEVLFETDPPMSTPLRRLYRVWGVRDGAALGVEEVRR